MFHATQCLTLYVRIKSQMRLEKKIYNVKYQSLPTSLGNFASGEFQNLSLSGENCRCR